MFTSAKEIVKTLLEKYGITEDTYQLYDVWDKELGKLAKEIQMVGKKNKIILVKADNPNYRQELKLRKKELIRKLNDYFGYEIVDDIKLI